MSFKIGENLRIKLVISQAGVNCETFHTLRAPSAREALGFAADETLALVSLRDASERDRIYERARVQAAQYDALVESVEGYELNGLDIMECENWRDSVPVDHKLEVIASRSRLAEVGLASKN